MNNAKPLLRPGMTAIAAVLALSSTPLFAQSAEPAATQAAPPLVTPPPVVAPAPATAAPAPAVQSAAPAPTITTPAPMVATPSPTRTVVAPTPAAEPAVRSPRPAARVAAPAPRAAPAAPTVSTAPAAPRVVAATPAPVAPPPAPVIAEPAVAPAPAPAPRTVDASGDMLPIAGAAGAAILLLGGGAYALSRRRRREDEDLVYATDETTVPVAATPAAPEAMIPEAYARPVGYVEPRFAPTPAPAHSRGLTADDNLPDKLPSGFDISRFGRHTKAAYLGPTPGNPSHSLRNRLKRASFFDQRERMAAEGTLPEQTSAARPAAPAQPAMAQRQADHVTTRINPPPRPGFRPAYSS